MLVATNRFGREQSAEVPDEQIYEFQAGLGGLKDPHRYALIVEPDMPVE